MGKLQGRRDWFNDEDFWGEYAPVMFDDAHWAEVPIVADGVMGLARLDLYGDGPAASGEKSAAGGQRGPHLLDLCCGFGRLSAEFARRGFAVTGVDITGTYLRTARGEAAYEKLAVEYVRADIRDFRRPGFFDLTVNLYISFGYFDDERDDRIVLQNVYESLKPGGVFIMETLGKEIAVRDFTEAEWFERAGCTVLTEYEAVDSWTRLKNRWILLKDGKRREKIFTQRLYAASELRSLFLEAGFAKVELYGDWDESPYDQYAVKLIVVGRKGG
ncbi:MAG: class I SAM-dependent methyltransferase [Treponema sp.]|jgi:SAM-dependent methyltransferase|nr:class I SAM-dependent methyltransferase [Treponema sp.]